MGYESERHLRWLERKRFYAADATAIMLPSSTGYRDFADYAMANNPRDYAVLDVQDFLSGDLGRSSRLFDRLDSDTDSADEFSDANSQLEEHHFFDGRGRKQIIFIGDSSSPESLNQAFELAHECKVMQYLLLVLNQ